MGEKARIDPELIATLRKSSRPLRPEAALVRPATPNANEATPDERLRQLVEDLVTTLERVEEHLRERNASQPAEANSAGHTLFVSSPVGYTIVEREGPAPLPGEQIVVDGNAYRARCHRRSPFPNDRRTCVVVEPTRAQTAAEVP